jgi:dihydroorotase
MSLHRPASPLFFVNARLIDPATGVETRGGLYARDGKARG